jgi:4-hydroxy-3-methylbut-2-enyl diphosphate reductase
MEKNKYQISIDDTAGFCWGVVRTIEKVELCLEEFDDKKVYVLGEIIHNPSEIERLEKKGLKTLSKEDLNNFKQENSVVIIRAHGEPPSTYTQANKINLELVDATCPLVKNLQNNVRNILIKKSNSKILEIQSSEVSLRGFCDDKCNVNTSKKKHRKKLILKQTVLFSQLLWKKLILFNCNKL